MQGARWTTVLAPTHGLCLKDHAIASPPARSASLHAERAALIISNVLCLVRGCLSYSALETHMATADGLWSPSSHLTKSRMP